MQQNPYAAPTASTTRQHGHVQLGGPRDWTVGEVLSVGWTAVWKNPGVLIGGIVVVTLIQQAVSYAINAALPPVPPTDVAAVLLRSLLTLPVTLLIGTFFAIGHARVALAAARDEPVELGMFFSGMDRIVPGYIAFLILYAGTIVGTLFLIVPGIILLLGWSLVYLLMADTKLSVTEILKESWQATKGQKMRIFLFGFVACGVVFLGILALLIGVFVAVPVVMIAFAEIYMCITGRRQSES